MPAREPWLRRAMRRFAAHGARAPVGLLLAEHRRRARDAVLQRHERRIAELGPALERGEPWARRELRILGDEAFDQMQGDVKSAVRPGTTRGWAASMDAWWRTTSEEEYLDDGRLDRDLRIRILQDLDAMNDLLGSYQVFFGRLKPLTRKDGPLRVLDLAAGHGGFAVAMADMARTAGMGLELVVTDIRPEYLALGQERARELGLALRFSVQDALDLSNVEPGRFDVVVSTQSLHHFTPGQVAVMFAEAARVAARGVVFIDGARSALTGAFAAGFGFVYYRNRGLAHDTLLSFRRFFVPEELELLARLSPRGRRARADWIPPSHCSLELCRS